MSDLDLCYLTATEAIARFKARKLSPVELMRAVIARCEAVNPSINAITHSFFDRALAQARQAERRFMKTDGRVRPLEGLPLAIKDLHFVKGEIATLGSRIYEHARGDHTAPTVQRLFDAGAIMHVRTTTPEFGHTGMTHSPLWGVTRNPWNRDYTPGGSSGGSAAAVAAGMTILADGTDGGGSIRIPASACGLAGFKPPFGRNPYDPILPRESIGSYGPIARCIADAALMQNAMSGVHPADACTLRERCVLPQQFGPIKGWKVAVSLDLGYHPIDTEVRRNTLDAIDVFRSLGCKVVLVDVGWNWGNLNCWMTHWLGLFASLCGSYLPRWRFEMDPNVVALIERGQRLAAAEFYACNNHRGWMYSRLAPILEEYDILICPTLAVPAVRCDHDQNDPDFMIDGQRVPAMYGWIMTPSFNLMSECPVMSVPSGRARSGVPTGIQIVGRTYDDLRVFRAAAAYEAANPWRAARPSL